MAFLLTSYNYKGHSAEKVLLIESKKLSYLRYNARRPSQTKCC